MSALVDQEALEDFLEHANADRAHRVAVALEAMAAAARLAAVELEVRARRSESVVSPTPLPTRVG